MRTVGAAYQNTPSLRNKISAAAFVDTNKLTKVRVEQQSDIAWPWRMMDLFHST